MRMRPILCGSDGPVWLVGLTTFNYWTHHNHNHNENECIDHSVSDSRDSNVTYQVSRENCIILLSIKSVLIACKKPY